LPTHSEPFGWVFIEALATGLPVIATDLNAIPEIVSHKETGFLIAPSDHFALTRSLCTLMDYPHLCLEMGMRGRQVAEQMFDVHKNFQLLESLFREVGLKQSCLLSQL
jgi:glycosyltransferase involved in cell wall biosynthesis